MAEARAPATGAPVTRPRAGATLSRRRLRSSACSVGHNGVRFVVSRKDTGRTRFPGQHDTLASLDACAKRACDLNLQGVRADRDVELEDVAVIADVFDN